MIQSIQRPRRGLAVRLALAAASLAAVAVTPLEAQVPVRLSAGDSVRVDGRIVGRVLNIEGTTMVVVSREVPRCRAGVMHGEASVCDPAPLVRHTLDLGSAVVERRMRRPDITKRTLFGGLLGAAAFGTAGYFFGPSVGFGRVEGCIAGSTSVPCATGEARYTEDELDALQKRSDQRKGAAFFGVIGGTATAVLVNRLSRGWVRVEPVTSVAPSGSWDLGLSLPTPR